jgi:hypothetical protein
MGTQAGYGPPLEDNVAFGWFINAGDAIDEGGFSGAVRSNQGHNLMFGNIEADIPKDNQAPESHREVSRLEQRSRLRIVGHHVFSQEFSECNISDAFTSSSSSLSRKK